MRRSIWHHDHHPDGRIWRQEIACKTSQVNRRARRARHVRFRPILDPMEDRTLLSTLTVTNNHDSGTGSLRATIAAASAGDTIKFSPRIDGQTKSHSPAANWSSIRA